MKIKKSTHIYLRGNYQQEMFYDKDDFINVWNRLWLSAAATGTKILSATFMNNHFHLTVVPGPTDFMHHFRMSITAYHNKRYNTHGMLGMRLYNESDLKDIDDLKDCICYHIRNVLHHHISQNFMDYPFSTARYIFNLADQSPMYTRKNLNLKMSRAYLPARERLPEGWAMNREYMIIPPGHLFLRDFLEDLFQTKESYLKTLSKRTRREKDDAEIPIFALHVGHLRKTPTRDEDLIQFVQENCRIPIPSMTPGQKMEAIYTIIDQYPKTNVKLLSRLFGIPYSTIRYRIKTWHFT